MKPQRSLLSKRSHHSSLNGQRNQWAELSQKKDESNQKRSPQKVLDKSDPVYYNLKIDKG